MSNFLKRNLKGDPVVWMIWFLIILVSVLELFSASSALIGGKGTIARPILRHVMFLTAGFGVMLITQLISIKYLRILGYVGVFISFFLLLYTWGFAQEKAGAARCLERGGFKFQPSEIDRLWRIIVAADWIDRFQNREGVRKAYW